MTTEIVKNPSTAMRTNAPIVGTHLPTLNETMAAMTANQMNASTNTTSNTVAPPRIFAPGSGCPLLKNSVKAVSAVMPRTPPTQIGFDIQ